MRRTRDYGTLKWHKGISLAWHKELFMSRFVRISIWPNPLGLISTVLNLINSIGIISVANHYVLIVTIATASALCVSQQNIKYLSVVLICKYTTRIGVYTAYILCLPHSPPWYFGTQRRADTTSYWATDSSIKTWQPQEKLTQDHSENSYRRRATRSGTWCCSRRCDVKPSFKALWRETKIIFRLTCFILRVCALRKDWDIDFILDISVYNLNM